MDNSVKAAHVPEVLIDDAEPGEPTRLLRFTGFVDAIAAHEAEEVAPAFAALEAALSQGLHAAGYFSYELGYLLEPRLTPLLWPERRVPLLWFGLFRACERLGGSKAMAALGAEDGGRAYAGPLVHEFDPALYRPRYRKIKNYIAAGDVYQVNLTFRSRFAFLGNPRALYRDLRQAACAAHSAYVDDGERTILSLSPELFFTLKDRWITTRPMKGTAARGANEEEDAKARIHLQASDKSRAENLMIVDLLRNDLGRVAEMGSVKVDDLFAVETYPTLHQMVSSVRARLKPGTRPEALIRAIFPCGSVTGAPKIRAMEIIRECETSPRGVYCGAIGYFAPDGRAAFNVAIRTLTITDGWGELGIGGGLVQDSEEAAEYAECLLKARYYEVQRKPIGLIETLRHEPSSGFVRIDLHLDRMMRSARALGLAFDRTSARQALDGAVAGETRTLRVRLTLDEVGKFAATAELLAGENGRVWTYVVSPVRLSSADALARHKTNWRAIYDEEQARAARETGADEVIFLNERDEVVEASRTNVFARIGGRLVTPPLSAGALGGCLRRALLDDPQSGCVEGGLTLDDLKEADAVYLGNSLRGLMRAVPAETKTKSSPLLPEPSTARG